MVERFLSQTSFVSQEDYRKNLHIRVPENFNFGYDVVDAYAAEQPGKEALLWTDDQGAEIRFTFADIKRESDRTASYFQSLGIGKGDVVMLILKRRYEFWFSILALHKLGAVVIPATHLLTKKDVVYRCNTAGIKAPPPNCSSAWVPRSPKGFSISTPASKRRLLSCARSG